MSTALVIGAGPAGLMAAEELALAGIAVTVVDAKPSVGRKFLMAGKSGLNLTKDEPAPRFLAQFGNRPELTHILTEFGPTQVRDWAQGLGIEVFTGSSGRVFPKAMKASPLLRAWLARLAGLGVAIRTRMKCTGQVEGGFAFDTPAGREVIGATVTVLAMGGASWARLGSDGAWPGWIGADVAPFQPANVGLSVAWSEHMQRHFGAPVKSVRLSAGDQETRGEFVISQKGLEGGGIYALSKVVRDEAPLYLDLVPDVTRDEVAQRLSRPRGKSTQAAQLRKALKLDPARLALLQEFGRPLPQGAALAGLIKRLEVRHAGPRPIDEAISTAGGLLWSALNPGLMIKDNPGVFAAGEMLDWEAPTGGYLINACLATGRHAGRSAVSFARAEAGSLVDI